VDRSTNVASAQAILVFGVADPRGIDNDPDVEVNGRVAHFATGALDVLPGAGVNLALGGVDIANGSTFDFAVPLKLTGSERLAIAPAGSATTVMLKSDWSHPSFQGRFLPITRTVTPAGFAARWEVSHLARNFDSLLKTAAAGVVPETLDISFIQPVNIYLESERAVKYGILFIVLTFAAFFLTEILRRLAIHPLQYLLVGLALAIFFLLLIALSEHLKFGVAYALSAAACIALVGVYLSAVLGGRLRGLAFLGGLAALYAILYAVILSEDNALLMGAFLLFGALGVTMLATRRVDWYALGAATNSEVS
jgi:inner membrane protein